MRRILFALAAVLSLAGSASLAPSAASAMTMNGKAITDVAKQTASTEDVRVVCRRYWNGYYWVRRCWRTGGYYYAPRVYRRHRYYYY